MSIVIGLGNPGKEYELTRHNAGRIVLSHVAEKHSFSSWKKEKMLTASVSEGLLGEEPMLFVYPETYMNLSGETVLALLKNGKEVSDLVVVYDDIDIPIGSMKISFDRSSGGHNGVESVISATQSKEFTRIRIGICPVSTEGEMVKPKSEGGVREYVLKPFTQNELKTLEALSDTVAKALEVISKEGVLEAMTRYNKKTA